MLLSPTEHPAAASEGAWDGAHAGLASTGAPRLFFKSDFSLKDAIHAT